MIRVFFLSCLIASLVAGPLRAQDPAQAEVKKTAGEMMQFYANASQDHFEQINASLARHQDLIVKMGNRNRFDVLAATFLARGHEKFDYEIKGDGPVIDLARDIVARNTENKRAVFVNDNQAITPGKLDVWWVSFFTTGETRYLELLLKQTGDAKAVPDNPAAATIRRVANWSFKSNCKNHDVVREFAAEAMKLEKWADKKAFLDECLQSD